MLTLLWSAGPATAQAVCNGIALRPPAQCSTGVGLRQVMAEKRLVLRDESQPAHSHAKATPCERIQQQPAFHWLERAFTRSALAFLASGLSVRNSWVSHRVLDEYGLANDTAPQCEKEFPNRRLRCEDA